MKATGKPAVWPVRHRTGHFIWIEGESKPHHFFLFARGRMHVPQEPVAARLHITASDRYVLYVNGHYVGRGPARSDPTRKSFDTYAVGALLHVGANVIAVRAYHYGPDSRDIGWTPSQGSAYAHGERAGLWVELEVDSADGSRKVSGTSGDWRVRPARGWDRAAREISYLIGTSEIYDAAADPVDWMEPGFNDAAWDPAWVIPQRGLVWVLLEERETPMLVEREVWPQGIVAQGEVIDLGAAHQTDIARVLDAEVHRPLEHASIHNIDAVLQHGSEAAEFRGCFAGYLEGRRVPFAIFDFGRQLDGYPRIQLTAPQGVLIDITHGQHLQGGRVHNGMAYGDRYITREGTQRWELSDYRQFRYLHVAVRSAYAPVRIHGVSVNEYAYPDRKPRATFECSDPTLTRLWDACVNTTYIGLKDDLEHEFYRERVVFRLGDASAILHHVLSTWGDIELADRFLRQATLSTRGDGLIRAAYPPGSSQTHMWMPFPLQWSSKVRDHYLFTGKDWVLDELYRTVPRVMDWFEPHRDARGLLRDLPYWNWQDWAPVDLRGANTITNALYVKSLEDAAWLADRVGTAKDAETWRRIAGEVRQAIRQELWDDAKGVYADSHHNGSLTGVVSELANAYAVLYGVATADQIPCIGAYLAAEHPDTVRSTPAFMGFVVDGMMIAGASVSAMKLMRDRYGPMLAWEDVPTIWEGWGPFTGSQAIDSDAMFSLQDEPRVAGERSLVHTSGCCVGYALSKRVLGVMPTGPGFTTCEIHPCPGDLDWARGAYPTPHGDLHVAWQANDDGIELKVDLPRGVAATVVLDRPTLHHRVVERNGETVRFDVSRLPPELEVTPDQVRIGPLTGSEVIALRQSGTPAAGLHWTTATTAMSEIPMEHVPLGPTDQMIASIGFGTARYHGEPGVLGRAIELGATLIDTAESYNADSDEPGGAERIVRRELEQAGAPAFVATKVSAQNLRYDSVIAHAHASRERLGIDVIDLYQIHSPSATIPITETMAAMEQLVADGVIRYIGVSNFDVEQMAAAQDALETSPLVSNQVPYSVLDRRIEADVLPYCQANDITVIAYAPLALGRVISGPEADHIRQVADAAGKTPAQVVIRWLLDHDRVIAIPKTEQPERVDELCGAAGWTLTVAQREALDALCA